MCDVPNILKALNTQTKKSHKCHIYIYIFHIAMATFSPNLWWTFFLKLSDVFPIQWDCLGSNTILGTGFLPIPFLGHSWSLGVLILIMFVVGDENPVLIQRKQVRLSVKKRNARIYQGVPLDVCKLECAWHLVLLPSTSENSFYW